MTPMIRHRRHITVFYVLIGKVVTGLMLRFNAVMGLSEIFDFSWKYLTISERMLEKGE
jgi:hypothetical protein